MNGKLIGGTNTGGGRVLLAGAERADIGTMLPAQSTLHGHAATSAKVIKTLRADNTVDLVLITPTDRLEPWLEMCRTVKFDARTGFVAVVFLLDAQLAGRTLDVLGAGADDCIAATADPAEIRLRLSRAIHFKRATDGLDDAGAVITALASAVEGKDAYTCGHVERVGDYSVQLGRRLNVDAEGLSALRIGGVVHDIGKIGIPDQILNKPGKLTDEEMAIMQRHPLIGYDILKPLRTFQHVLPIVRWHHEKPNGTGYPDKLPGDQLPLLPRIAAVADCFDALTTSRPYRAAFSFDKACEILRGNAERGELDQTVIDALFAMLADGAITPIAATRAA